MLLYIQDADTMRYRHGHAAALLNTPAELQNSSHDRKGILSAPGIHHPVVDL